MKKGELLGKMIPFMTAKHAGQFDRGGKPYCLHPLQVMHNPGPDADEELQCIALGHDLLEDTDTTIRELLDLGMTERVIFGIKILTKMPGQSYEEYVELVKSNLDTIRVKKADLEHNTDLKRLKGVSDKDISRAPNVCGNLFWKSCCW